MPPLSDNAQQPDLEQIAVEWLVRLRGGDMNDDEVNAFADWLAADYRHAQAFASAEDLFDDMVHAARHQPIAAIDSVKALARTQSPSRRQRRWLPVALAMAAVWLIAVILIMPENAHPLDGLLSDYHTDTGELRDIELADGSHILLNTNSAVSVNFDASLRRINLLHGQARFTVARDRSRPFEVVADGLTTRALGTVFEVFRADDAISVTVQQHAVSIDMGTGDSARNIKLQTGQRLQIYHGDSAPRIETIALDQSTAWQQRRLLINDRPLGELIAELNRYRSGRIFLSDPQLNNLHVSGSFSLDNPEAIVTTVSQVLDLQQTRLGQWWLVLHR